MDTNEARSVVYSRIQSLEPENVSKIMGYLFLQDYGEQEIIRLAFSPDSLIQSLIVKAKKDLGLLQQQQQGSATIQSYLSRFSRHSLPPIQPPMISQVSSRLFSSSPSALSPHAPPWASPISQQTRPSLNNLHVLPNELHTNTISTTVSSNTTNNGYLNYSIPSVAVLDQANKLPLMYNVEHPALGDSGFQLQDQLPFLNDASESPNSHGNYLSYPEMLAYCSGNQLLNMDHISSTANNNCNGVMSKRPSSIVDICNMNPDAAGSASAWKPCMYFARGYCKNGSNCRFLHGGVRAESDYTEDSMGSSNGSLEKLELELQDLLRGRSPVSLSSLPQLYVERFGKSLQAETQRYRSERDHDRLGPANPGSRQIYLTFPAESTFKEEDVSNYFSIFGPVQDVRIPYQQKRMFGFVTFVYQETVKIILNKGNPHYVCDARVLVKPYREKGSKPAERKYSGYVTAQNLDIRDSNLHFGPPRLMGNNNTDAATMRRQFEDDVEQAIELQTKRFADLQLCSDPQLSLTPKSSTANQENQLCNSPLHNSEEDATASEDISNSTLADHFAYLLQVLDNEPSYDEPSKSIDHHQDRCLVPNGAIRM